jgi:pyrimidine operon attenuation protein/uracil phosphoribosyltransferase
MNIKKRIMEEKDIKRTLMRLSHEITEKHKGVENIVLAGIKTRGAFIAERIKENLIKIEDFEVPVVKLDVTPFRDDDKKSNNDTSEFDLEIKDKTVILVDDVLFTGRTIRAAMDAVISRGRPSQIELLVLVDRGHREFPIKANFIGKNLPTSKTNEAVEVKLAEIDKYQEEGVYIYDND